MKIVLFILIGFITLNCYARTVVFDIGYNYNGADTNAMPDSALLIVYQNGSIPSLSTISRVYPENINKWYVGANNILLVTNAIKESGTGSLENDWLHAVFSIEFDPAESAGGYYGFRMFNTSTINSNIMGNYEWSEIEENIEHDYTTNNFYITLDVPTPWANTNNFVTETNFITIFPNFGYNYGGADTNLMPDRAIVYLIFNQDGTNHGMVYKGTNYIANSITNDDMFVGSFWANKQSESGSIGNDWLSFADVFYLIITNLNYSDWSGYYCVRMFNTTNEPILGYYNWGDKITDYIEISSGLTYFDAYDLDEPWANTNNFVTNFPTASKPKVCGVTISKVCGQALGKLFGK